MNEHMQRSNSIACPPLSPHCSQCVKRITKVEVKCTSRVYSMGWKTVKVTALQYGEDARCWLPLFRDELLCDEVVCPQWKVVAPLVL